jgi:hypothetical protein
LNSNSSRYLAHLDASIATARTTHIADRCKVERAIYLTRLGRLVEATETISDLRAKYQPAPNAEMSAWLNLAEGLLIHFENLGSAARDKVLRAHAFSNAANLSSLMPLSAAWLSQMDFMRHDYVGTAKHVKQALQVALPDDHSARSRANMVVAQALHLSGRFDLAQPWYRRSHFHASSQGDDASISAILHNMVGNRLDNLRQFKLTGVGEGGDERLVLSGTESTSNFDKLIGASSFKSLTALLRARVFSLRGQPMDALALYEEHMSRETDLAFSRMKSEFLSDVAWCQIQTKQLNAALTTAKAAEDNLDGEIQIDDRAATHTRLAWIYSVTQSHELSAMHHKLAAEAWGDFVLIQSGFVKSLDGLTELG